MLRNFPDPFHAGVLHGDVGVEPLGDRSGDQGRPLLLQQLDQPLLLLDQAVNPRGFSVEEVGDAALG